MATNECLSCRGLLTKTFPNFIRTWAGQARRNQFHKVSNSEGIVDLGAAENKLCEDIVSKRLSGQDINQHEIYMQYYPDFTGVRSFKESVATFLTDRLHTYKPLKPENVLITSGVGAALDLLAHVLADPGECFLSPTPYYPRIKTDIGERSQVRTIDVHLSSLQGPGENKPFQLTVGKLEAAYHNARQQGLIVKGIILMNPHNPLGDIYSIELVREILDFAKKYELHVISDEIYALSVFDESKDFQSILTIPDLPDPKRTHFVWGFSKDFSLSGFRCGMIYSFNPAVTGAISPLLYYGSVPPLVQKKLQILITDTDWLNTIYFPTNLSRMRTAYSFLKRKLEDLGIEVYTSPAGYYIWANFSRVFHPVTEEAEMELFKRLFKAGVYIVPGSAMFYNEPGWFRLIFTRSQDYVEEGLRRLKRVLEDLENNPLIAGTESA